MPHRIYSSNTRKKFSGLTYYWYGWTSRKQSAELSAENLRAKGNLARIEEDKDGHYYGGKFIPAGGYHIWRRKG